MISSHPRPRLRLAVVGIALIGSSVGSFAVAPTPSDVPLHLFYLHGAIVEGNNPRPEHPRLGVYDYPAVVEAFEATGVVVHTQQRPAGLSVEDHATALANEIRQLLASGVSAARIAVAGHSKGGVIALRASEQLARTPDRSEPGLDPAEIRWIFLAACFPNLESAASLPPRSLSLFDGSDQVAVSCRPWMTETAVESTLETGLGHGLFYRPNRAWLDPLFVWLENDE